MNSKHFYCRNDLFLFLIIISSTFLQCGWCEKTPVSKTEEEIRIELGNNWRNAILEARKKVAKLSTLYLLPAEIKIFAGHALNLLRVKCPSVNSKVIHDIHQFVGRTRPAQYSDTILHQRTDLHDLLTNLQVCTHGGAMRQIIKQRTMTDFALLKLQDLGLTELLINFNLLMESTSNFFADAVQQINKALGKTTSLIGTTKDVLQSKSSYQPETSLLDKKLEEFGYLLFSLYVKSCESPKKNFVTFQAAFNDFRSHFKSDRNNAQKAVELYLTEEFFHNITSCSALQ